MRRQATYTKQLQQHGNCSVQCWSSWTSRLNTGHGSWLNMQHDPTWTWLEELLRCTQSVQSLWTPNCMNVTIQFQMWFWYVLMQQAEVLHQCHVCMVLRRCQVKEWHYSLLALPCTIIIRPRIHARPHYHDHTISDWNMGKIMTILVAGQYCTLPLWWPCLCDQLACYDEHDKHSTPMRTSTGAASM